MFRVANLLNVNADDSSIDGFVVDSFLIFVEKQNIKLTTVVTKKERHVKKQKNEKEDVAAAVISLQKMSCSAVDLKSNIKFPTEIKPLNRIKGKDDHLCRPCVEEEVIDWKDRGEFPFHCHEATNSPMGKFICINYFKRRRIILAFSYCQIFKELFWRIYLKVSEVIKKYIIRNMLTIGANILAYQFAYINTYISRVPCTYLRTHHNHHTHRTHQTHYNHYTSHTHCTRCTDHTHHNDRTHNTDHSHDTHHTNRTHRDHHPGSSRSPVRKCLPITLQFDAACLTSSPIASPTSSPTSRPSKRSPLQLTTMYVDGRRSEPKTRTRLRLGDHRPAIKLWAVILCQLAVFGATAYELKREYRASGGWQVTGLWWASYRWQVVGL